MRMKVVPDEPSVEIPQGIKCKFCGKVARSGQFVMHERIRNFGHLLWHFDCVSGMVEDARDTLTGSVEDEFKRIAREETGIYDVLS